MRSLQTQLEFRVNLVDGGLAWLAVVGLFLLMTLTPLGQVLWLELIFFTLLLALAYFALNRWMRAWFAIRSPRQLREDDEGITLIWATRERTWKWCELGLIVGGLSATALCPTVNFYDASGTRVAEFFPPPTEVGPLLTRLTPRVSSSPVSKLSRLRSFARVFFFCGLAMVVFGCFALGFGSWTLYGRHQLETAAKPGTAVITKKFLSPNKVNGLILVQLQEVPGTHEVLLDSRDYWEELAVGQKLEALWVPGRDDLIRLMQHQVDPSLPEIVFIILGGLCITPFGLYAIGLGLRYYRGWELQQIPGTRNTEWVKVI